MRIMSYNDVYNELYGCEEIYAHKYAISRAREKRFFACGKSF